MSLLKNGKIVILIEKLVILKVLSLSKVHKTMIIVSACWLRTYYLRQWDNDFFRNIGKCLAHTLIIGPLHVIWQVSFGCWIMWSISSWQNSYNSVVFPKAEWWVADLLFPSLNNWGLNFLQNESSQSWKSRKLTKNFTFQSCKFLNDKIDQNTKFAKLPSAK